MPDPQPTNAEQQQETPPTGFTPAPEAETSPRSRERSAGARWFDDLTNRLGFTRPASDEPDEEPKATDAEEPDTTAEPDEQAEQESTPEARPEPQPVAAAQTDETLTLTREQLGRMVQAETDRREAKRLRDEQAAELKRKAKEQPFDFAEEWLQEAEQAEQRNVTAEQMQQALTANLQQAATVYDRNVVDPVATRLTEAELMQLQAEAHAQPNGVEGRRVLIEGALKTLEKRWRAEGAKVAEEKLRKNDAFRKEILRELQGEEEEPDLVQAVGPASNGRGPDMDTLIRQMADRSRR